MFKSTAICDRVAALGSEVAPMTPAEFAERGRRDAERFGAIIKERKIVGD
jgi:hypothetical protein